LEEAACEPGLRDVLGAVAEAVGMANLTDELASA